MRRYVSLVLPIAALALACTDAPVDMLHPGPLPPVARSGSRLAARYVVAPGGAERFLHFVVRDTNEPCRLTQSTDPEDKRVTCLPIADGTIVHATPSCDQPLLYTNDGDHEWVNAYERYELKPIRLGDHINVEAVYIDSGRGGCIPFDVPLGDIYTIAERQDVATWPGGTFELRELTDDLEGTMFVGEDGSEMLYDLVDRFTGSQCRPGRTEVGARCIPESDGDFEDDGLFDATCSERLMADYGRRRFGTFDGAYHRFEFVERDTRVARLVDDVCVVDETFQLGRKTLFRMDAYPEAAWPEVWIAAVGGPAVTADVAMTDEQTPLDVPEASAVDRLFDMAPTGGCGPAYFGTELRCAPAYGIKEASWRTAFADSLCSIPAVAYDEGVTPGPFARRVTGRSPPQMGALPVVTVHMVVGRSRSAGYDLLPDGTCQASPFEHRVFFVGEEVPASQFEALTLVER